MLLVSKCLLGENCKYNGGNNRNEAVLAYLQDKPYIAVCPEYLGGLPIPRVPSEIRNGKVYAKTGADLTAQFEKGAQAVLDIAKKNGVTTAILKQNSPSCGSGQIYDGTFTGKKIKGDGITAALLKSHNITIFSEEDIIAFCDKI